MQSLAVDELDRRDAAFSGNRLLSTFSADSRALIEPSSEYVELQAGDRLFERGQQVEHSVFPFASAMVALVLDLEPGRSIEVASIGREGAVGGIVSCGNAPAFSEARVLISGPALKVPIAALEDAKQRSDFVANLFCRYADYLLAQVMQSVPCNAFHTITDRAARWLLTAQDRAGDRIELTQDALAALLGVQRTTVNAVIRTLQDQGLVESGRGVVRVTDRAGLKRRACPCYHVVEDHFSNVIGPSGLGGSSGCS